MTREEAKNRLDFLKKAYQKLIDEKVDRGKLVGDGVRGEWKAETPLDEAYKNVIEALDMAIKALEQEHCNDAISRQAAHNMVRSLSRWCVRSEDGKWNNVGLLYDDVQFGLDKLPSVTPQPKMGRWIMSDDGLYRPICNNCGAHPWKGYIPTVEEATEAFKYCPHCGYAMQGVEE